MIPTLHLFPILDQKLIELLRSLQAEDWNKPTIAKKWTVKDIVAHLLDGNFRVLSMMRDGYMLPPDRPIHSYNDLVAFLNQLNADFVTALKRTSPQLLIQLLEATGKEYSEQLSNLDPGADAMFSVAWAGEETSKNWFHIAREYTEKWHHQQQIRDAVGQQGIMTRELFYPVMDTFMRGLPHAYKDANAGNRTLVHIGIDTDLGGDWYIEKVDKVWKLIEKPNTVPHASLVLQPDAAWKVFTKGITGEEALLSSRVEGNEELAKVALGFVAVMASR